MDVTHLLIHSTVSGHLGCCQLWAVKSKIAMNIRVHVSYAFLSLGEMSGVA